MGCIPYTIIWYEQDWMWCNKNKEPAGHHHQLVVQVQCYNIYNNIHGTYISIYDICLIISIGIYIIYPYRWYKYNSSKGVLVLLWFSIIHSLFVVILLFSYLLLTVSILSNERFIICGIIRSNNYKGKINQLSDTCRNTNTCGCNRISVILERFPWGFS